MRDEELGIDAFALLGRVLLCAALPRALPMADGFLPFQDVGSAKRGDWEYTYIIGC